MTVASSPTSPPGPHSVQVKKNERSKAESGKEMADFLLERYEQAHPDTKTDDHKWRMFCEIVKHNAFDVAGNRYARAEDGSKFSYFDQIFQLLKKKRNMEGQAAFDYVLAHLSSYTKGFVQTPHPTEVLTRKAIEAEQAFHMELEHNLELFNGRLHRDVPEQELDKVLGAMHELLTAMQPLKKSMTPDQEMRRSILFSKKMFDSVPLVVQSILDGAKREGAYDGKPLALDQLLAFNFIIQPETWSPGDRDSKEEMTSKLLQEGIERSEKAMSLHYICNLATLISDMEADPVFARAGETLPKLRTVMWRMLQHVKNPQEVEHYLTEQFKDTQEDNAIIAEIRRLHDAVYFLDDSKLDAYIAKNLEGRVMPEVIRDIRRAHTVDKTREAPAYSSNMEFIEDLEVIRDTPGAAFPAYRFADGKLSDLSKLDMLYVQANNFGQSALRSQIRENSEMHSEVMEMLAGFLQKRGFPLHSYDASKHKQAYEYAIKHKKYDPQNEYSQYRKRIAEEILETLQNNPDRAARLHAALHNELESLKDTVPKLREKIYRHKYVPSDEEKRNIKFYETLKGFETAALNPQQIPRYLIAECHSDIDMLEAFLMLKAMEPDETRNVYKDKHGQSLPKVEIVPLFEYRYDVERVPEFIADVYKNPYFKQHHDSMVDANDPAISVPLEDRGARSAVQIDKFGIPHIREPEPDHRPLTVAEAKKIYNIALKPGDDKKPIRATKIVMFAGSDITKSSGCAGAGLVLRATHELRESMLNADDPILLIDYTGSGGGIHRSQPVSSMYETVQGRSMRQSDFSVSQKILITMGRWLRKYLGLEDEPKINGKDRREQLLTAQLNLGNLAGLQFSTAADQINVRARLNADMDRYETLYNSPEYAACLAFSADPFIKLASSFAARAGARSRGEVDKGAFPPLVDVGNLRAIGYGGALNTAGSCVSDYYGISAFLGLDHQGNISAEKSEELTKLYLSSPVMQDCVNRATYGVVMANFKTAWAYLGAHREYRDEKTGISKNNLFTSMETLAADSPEMEALKNKIREKPTELNLEEKEKLAAHVLGKIDIEYQRALRGLTQLHRQARQWAKQPRRTEKEIREVIDKPQLVPDIEHEQKALLAELPILLRQQLIESRKDIDPARGYLAGKFHDILRAIVEHNGKFPDKESDIYPPIYYANGASIECFENVPRPYTRQSWAINYEKSMDLTRAA